jgi:hypothetical protein
MEREVLLPTRPWGEDNNFREVNRFCRDQFGRADDGNEESTGSVSLGGCGRLSHPLIFSAFAPAFRFQPLQSVPDTPVPKQRGAIGSRQINGIAAERAMQTICGKSRDWGVLGPLDA